MKYIIALLSVLLPFSGNAITWKVVGPCSEKPLFEGSFNADLKKSLGATSIQIFDLNKIAYVGAAEGMNSINNSPTGLDAMEVLSDTEMRAYGWCFSINGQIPEAMPHKVSIKSQQDQVVWFYGYSTNSMNKWLDYCVPGYKIKADQFCK